MSQKLWTGRFKEKTARIVETFTSSIDVDRRLYAYDIQRSIAHCKTLAKARIITDQEARELIKGLKAIDKEIKQGAFEFSDRLEDIHTHIETRLAEIVGKVALKLHTGRSRNDQVALDVRMYLRDQVAEINYEKIARAAQLFYCSLHAACQHGRFEMTEAAETNSADD